MGREREGGRKGGKEREGEKAYSGREGRSGGKVHMYVWSSQLCILSFGCGIILTLSLRLSTYVCIFGTQCMCVPCICTCLELFSYGSNSIMGAYDYLLPCTQMYKFVCYDHWKQAEINALIYESIILN